MKRPVCDAGQEKEGKELCVCVREVGCGSWGKRIPPG